MTQVMSGMALGTDTVACVQARFLPKRPLSPRAAKMAA